MINSSIIQALEKLDIDNKYHWTADGLPRIDVISEMTGIRDLKRGDITSAAPTFTRENPVFDIVKATESEVIESEVLTENEQFNELPDDEISIKFLDNGVKNEEIHQTEEVDELTALELAVKNAEVQIAEADALLAELQKTRLKAVAERDALLEKQAKNINPHQNQIDIMAFLRKQQELRIERASRVKQIVFSEKSPIDKAMERKKGFGISRPQIKTNGT